MADAFTAQVVGVDEIQRLIDQLTPALNPKVIGGALTEMLLLTLRTSQQKHIKRGGKGPPAKAILTSRTGNLRRSISGSGAVDRSNLPDSIRGGSALVYAGVHEKGGTFAIPATNVGPQARTQAFGKRFNVFEVPAHTRKAHTMTVPARPFLAPALDETEREFPAIMVKHLERALR